MWNKRRHMLRLPPLLIELRDMGRWLQPSDLKIQQVVPFLQGPVNFWMFADGVWGHLSLQLTESAAMGEQFHEFRGSRDAQRDLPWLDVEQALLIATNRIPGDDLAIALDYRSNTANPRVVASFWPEGTGRSEWRLVAKTFSDFVEKLGL